MAYVESEVTTKSYVKRQMVLMNRASAKCHRLQHFQFKAWPDHRKCSASSGSDGPPPF